MENTPRPLFYTGPSLFTAAAAAHDRLEKYIVEKLTAANAGDLEAWEFYSFLLEQAKKYRIHHYGFASNEYKADEAAALENIKNSKKENVSPPQSDNSRRGEKT